MHIVLHLGLEVALEEVEQVILDVDFLDLIVDGLQLRVNLIFFHFSCFESVFFSLLDHRVLWSRLPWR